MVVSLYTVRVVLDTLGNIDYGLYNVVGGIVALFTSITAILASASQRFFSAEIGIGRTQGDLSKIFSLNIILYLSLFIIILIVSETIGLYFVITQLNFPPERFSAVVWTYQFAVFSFAINLLVTPYIALVIANERMNVFAYISVLDGILKLAVAYSITYFDYDKLKLFAFLNFVIVLFDSALYVVYVKKKFRSVHIVKYWNKEKFVEILSFVGWNFYSSFSLIFRLQGINILLNIYFGPVVNAARAIAYKVSVTINGLVLNLQTAMRPKITQYYVQNKIDEMLKLVYANSKYSFFLLYFIALPFLFELSFIMQLWLKELPQYVILFTILVIIDALVESPSQAIETAMQGVGKLKKYQLITKSVELLNLPISYVFLKYGAGPLAPMFISISIFVVVLFIKVQIFSKAISSKSSIYYKNVLLKIILVTLFSVGIPFLITCVLPETFLRVILNFTITWLWLIIVIFIVGLDREEKGKTISLIRQKLYTRFYCK